MIFWIAIGICIWMVLQLILQVILLATNWKNHREIPPENLPQVSVWIALRNEERELPRLLKSLDDLDYPSDKIEFLLADDGSEDQTWSMLDSWAKKEDNKTLVKLTEKDFGRYHPNGKANALAILGKMATGDFYFFTDGDCKVTKNWIRAGVSSIHENTGMLIGVTRVRRGTLWDQMQELDWWNTLGLVKVVTDLGLPTTGLGNNMVMTKEAYESGGGFESLGKSLTEDLEISKAVRKAGYSIRQQVSEDLLVETKAEYSIPSLLDQRKRWVTGAMTLSLGWKILLAIQVFFFPAIIWLIFENLELGIRLWVLKIAMQSIFIGFFAKRAKCKPPFLSLFLYDFYLLVSYCLTILYYFWPSSVQWKARKYP
ncbi:glycosyltransferase [Algoriphagus mannitolivorans]|uniref:glycosyltransferase n=1 Tax=Algoriphagus mannitolivorans TaxID=226504 RepID=UPI000408871D|nr:glycosyltransferase [Algoriphagus mannitolivorans]